MKSNSFNETRHAEAWIRPGLYKKRVGKKGWGVFTRTPIDRGEIIGIDGGGTIWSEEKARKLRARWGDHFHQIADGFHWGPTKKGDHDIMEAMNHSCNPNTGISGDMTFMALRHIKSGEGITWDYVMTESDPEYRFACYCGNARCRKEITGDDWKRLDLQQKYHGHFAPYLERKVQRELEKRNLAIVGKKLFFSDRMDPNQISLHEIKRVIADHRSPYQHIQILDTKSFGRALALDGGAQISEKDGYMYTESLVWPTLLSHQDPRRVLILGGGDGDTIAEVLRDRRVKHVTMVDIDETVLRLAQRHLPMLWNDAQRDTRTTIIASLPGGAPADADRFLQQSAGQFDVIISDLTDPYESSASAALMQPSYFEHIKSRLATGGIFVIQAGELTALEYRGHRLVCRLTDALFSHTISYRVFVPWFNSMWSFVIASDSPRVRANIKNQAAITRLLAKYGSVIGGFSYLTPNSFAGLFSIEPSLAEKISPRR